MKAVIMQVNEALETNIALVYKSVFWEKQHLF